MASSWEFYVNSDAMGVAKVGYDIFDQAKSDLFFYWASQAMFHTFINKRTFHLIRVGLNEAAKGLETEEEEDSDSTTVFDNQDDDGNITF